MKFRTNIPIHVSDSPIQHSQKLLALGSCFVQNIGQRLLHGKFDLHLNPFGISYNPISIARQVDFLSGKRDFPADDFFLHEEEWHHFDLHGQWNDPDLAEAGKKLAKTMDQAANQLEQADWLIITLGSAFAFRHLESNQIVNNCHRLPGQQFERNLLSVDEIFVGLSSSLQTLLAQNSNTRVLLTVSPVRYLRDGLVNSQRSKAHLLTAVHQLCESLQRVEYFPAYELLIDDLRDYRFFARDLAHPSEEAIDYIWNHFSETYFSDATRSIYQEIVAFKKAEAHRPKGNSKRFHAFQESMKKNLNLLESKYPDLDWQAERTRFGV